ncbi:hypothetical protein FQR65_LT20746 [Abscondita terminalis]|nr:hypothetical protein FQR65_LT20746 [Abscondita terminalis]
MPARTPLFWFAKPRGTTSPRRPLRAEEIAATAQGTRLDFLNLSSFLLKFSTQARCWLNAAKKRLEWEKRLAAANAETALKFDAMRGDLPANFDDAINEYKKKLSAEKPKLRPLLHLEAGASALSFRLLPMALDLTVVYGVNPNKLDEGHQVISNASCTTTACASGSGSQRMQFGIEKASCNDHSTRRPADAGHHPRISTARAAAFHDPDFDGAAKGYGVPPRKLSVVDTDLRCQALDQLLKKVNNAIREAHGAFRHLGTPMSRSLSHDLQHECIRRSSPTDQGHGTAPNGAHPVWYDMNVGFFEPH